ncbi:MAG: RNA polymerase factor sigma-54 [Sumerlaeia bacterium]
MSLSLQQVLKQTQKLIMTPQMQQSIQLLQLNSMELEQMIHDEMLENPFLEMSDDEEDLRSEQDQSKDTDGGDPLADDSGLSDQERAKQHDDESVEREADEREPERAQDNDDMLPEEKDEYSEDFETFDQNDVDWNTEFSDSDTTSYGSVREDQEEHDFTTYTALQENLYDNLMRQLHLSVLDDRETEIGEFIIGNLDENGFLACGLENLAQIVGYSPDLIDLKGGTNSEANLRRTLMKLNPEREEDHLKQLSRKQLVASLAAKYLRITADEAMAMTRRELLTSLIARRIGMRVEEALEKPATELVLDCVAFRMKTDAQTVFDVLEVIQDFEPTGVGARDLAECLRLQCEEQGIRNRLLYRILDDHLKDLQQKKFRDIARAIGVPEEEVVDVFHLISHLEPLPGRSQTKDSPRYITPDVYVKKVDGKYMYFLNEGDASRLRIASNYRRMVVDKHRRAAAAHAEKNGNGMHDQNQAQYAHEKYKNAVWLIKNIEKRKSTVLRVTEAIMNYQHDFLEKGIEHLHPLTLRNIAEVVGMHESTIARVTTGKYVETPRGIFELKFFFSSGLETDSGEDASSRSIKEMLTKMIEEEDLEHPLSDQKIADMLREKGIQIARRTVAKYREQLKILPAKLRKQVGVGH